mgnify:CR=1 FL=1
MEFRWGLIFTYNVAQPLLATRWSTTSKLFLFRVKQWKSYLSQISISLFCKKKSFKQAIKHMTSTICNDLDDAKAEKAVKSLLKFEAKRIDERNASKLMDGNAKPILVQFQLKKPIKSPVIRPVRVKIPNSLFNPDGEDHSVCLFCRRCWRLLWRRNPLTESTLWYQ